MPVDDRAKDCGPQITRPTLPRPAVGLNPDRRSADPTRMTNVDLMQSTPPTRTEVEAFLDHLRPALIADGGNVELASIEDDGTVRVEMQGECARCPARLATLRVAIEEPLRRSHPGVSAVVAI